MIPYGTWEFAIEEAPGNVGFRVVVTTTCGKAPVGPRLLRLAPMPEQFTKELYPTKQEALVAKARWEEYAKVEVFGRLGKEIASRQKKMGKV